MGFIDWMSGLFGKRTLLKISGDIYELGAKVVYKKLAIETCIDLIANTLTRCEFKTFEKGKETTKENYYLLNVQPNQNQNASQFMKSLVSHLILSNECLVIMQNDQLYIADDFKRTVYAFRENIYSEITISDYQLNKTFLESDVLYFKLNDRNIMSVINGMYEDYGKLIASGINFYKRKNNKRLLIKGDFLRPQDEETQKAIDEMFESQLANWFNPDKEGSAFQVQNGYEFNDMSDGQKSTGNNGTSRDIRELVNDIIDFIAMAFHVPRGLLKGDIADIEKQIDGFLMFCIKPIAELIIDEFNRKMYSKEDYLNRTYLKMDTSQIKVVDITQLATAVDKLFAIGGLSINDILDMLGKEPINEDWANKRYVTKNYQEADTLKGGENHDK